MQAAAPDVLDLSRESMHLQSQYGVGNKTTDNFARQCLLARRLVEAGSTGTLPVGIVALVPGAEPYIEVVEVRMVRPA